jgi:hypothetical protein
MTDSNIKTVKIFNKAPEAEAEEPQEGGEKKRSTRKKKYIIKSVTVQKEGGGRTSPGTAEQLASTRVPGSDDTKAVGAVSGLTQSGATVGTIAPAISSGGALSVGARVVLAKSRKKSSVILAGPKPAAIKAHKKTAKKVHVNLKGLTRKVHKAKTIETKATETSLSDVKDTLVKAGLIKAETKAPESVLRQIYSDLMVLKKRAL